MVNNFKIGVFQECQEECKKICMNIKSSSSDDVIYYVKGTISSGDISCSCPGFKFRGTCKHLNLENVSCGWNSLDSPEPQTLIQKENHICPRCGGTTVDVASGDF